MKLRSRWSGVALFCLGLIMAVSCHFAPRPAAKTIQEPAADLPVQIGYSAWPGWFPWQVAQEQQLFATHAVKADLQWFDDYLGSINALTRGQLVSNSQTLNDTISAAALGADLVVVLVNDNSTGNDQIIVRPGITAIADLKGKKIAVEEGSVSHFLLLLGLHRAGLTQQDIQLHPLEVRQLAPAFLAGEVDAVGIFAPFTTHALQRPGSQVLFSSKDFPGAISDHLVFNRQFVHDRPQTVQAIVDTWFTTLDYIQAHPQAAIATMAKRANVSVSEYKEYNAGTRIFSWEDNLRAFQSGQDMTFLPYAAQKISQFLVETGLAKQAPDLSTLFDDRFVKAYAAKAKRLPDLGN